MDENIKIKELKGRVKESIIKLYALIASESKKSDSVSAIEGALDLLWGYYDELTKSEDGPVHITYDPDSLKIDPSPLGPITVTPLTNSRDQVVYCSDNQSNLSNTLREKDETSC